VKAIAQTYGPWLCLGLLIGVASMGGVIYAVTAMALGVVVVWGLVPTKGQP
jgi:hypothetical protein